MASLAARPARAGDAAAVVELFTSQGCSSCPPADQFAGELRRKPGIVVLTYHVDYWDYLGWKDTLAAPEFSRRQYDYARSRGDMDVFTPQMIVNGTGQFVGSKRDEVLAALQQPPAKPWAAAVTISHNGNEVALNVGEGKVSGEAMVWLIPIQPAMSVKIERGEMAGQTVHYHNVVRRLVPAGMWTGQAITFTFMADAVIPPECTGCVALLQHGKAGAIIGAGHAGDVMA